MASTLGVRARHGLARRKALVSARSLRLVLAGLWLLDGQYARALAPTSPVPAPAPPALS